MSFLDYSNTGSGMAPPSFSPGQWNPLSMISTFGQDLMKPATQALTTGRTDVTTPGGGAGSSGFGLNMDTGKMLLGGLQTVAGIWNAWESQKLAKKQFAYTKDVTESNLKNQIATYNTTLSDRSRSRAQTEGQSAETAQAYVDNNKLKR